MTPLRSDHSAIALVGDARRRSIGARLTACATDWFEEWGTAPAPTLTVTLQSPTAIAIETPAKEALRVVAGLADTRPVLRVETTRAALAHVLGLPRHAAAFEFEQDSLAAHVGAAVVESLAQRLLDGARCTHATVVAEHAANRISQPHWWEATLAWDSLCTIKLTMSAEFLEGLVPAPRPALTAVQRRRTAIGEAKLCVEAVLGEVEIAFGELATLAVNDVLVLSTPLSQPGRLIGASGREVAKVSFGRVERKRAVVISG